MMQDRHGRWWPIPGGMVKPIGACTTRRPSAGIVHVVPALASRLSRRTRTIDRRVPRDPGCGDCPPGIVGGRVGESTGRLAAVKRSLPPLRPGRGRRTGGSLERTAGTAPLWPASHDQPSPLALAVPEPAPPPPRTSAERTPRGRVVAERIRCGSHSAPPPQRVRSRSRTGTAAVLRPATVHRRRHPNHPDWPPGASLRDLRGQVAAFHPVRIRSASRTFRGLRARIHQTNAPLARAPRLDRRRSHTPQAPN